MSTFNPGTGGDLSATTLEAAIMETASLVDASERSQINAEDFTAALTLSVSVDDQSVSINYTPPISNTVEADGTVKIAATDYLSAAVNNGGGDMKSSTLAAGLLELIQLAANAESGTDDNNASVSFDLENNFHCNCFVFIYRLARVTLFCSYFNVYQSGRRVYKIIKVMLMVKR